jgi:uncharacterized membrane protein YozB (DUF420 family)
MIDKTQKRIIAISILLILLIISVVISQLDKGQLKSSSLITMIGVGILLILFIVFRPFRRIVLKAANIIGEDEDSIRTRPAWSLFVAVPISFVLLFYIFLGDTQVTVPPTLQFNIIIVSSTLGGLVLAAATISRGKRRKRRELLSVAQKFIVATLLFVLFTALFFIIELVGGINTNSFELTNSASWFRGICYWAALVSSGAGLVLFPLGMTDLVIALTHMRQKLNK